MSEENSLKAPIERINSEYLETPLHDFDFSQLQDLLTTGGPVIVLLGLMSLVALTVFLGKCWQFLSLGLNRYQSIDQSLIKWHHDSPTEAIAILTKTRTPLARVLEKAMVLHGNNSITENLAREEVLRIAKRQLVEARSHIKILEVIATLSPLLGLLGTVLGMIEAFQKLQGAGASIDPALLSGGIWEALLTTAAGLIVAIPCVLGLHWLEQRIEHFKFMMEDAVTQVFTTQASQMQTSTDTDPNIKGLKKEVHQSNLKSSEHEVTAVG